MRDSRRSSMSGKASRLAMVTIGLSLLWALNAPAYTDRLPGAGDSPNA